MRDILKERHHLVILGLVALVMLISANIAWLNPRPEYLVKTHERIPLFWQYNHDSGMEFMSSARFPEMYKEWPSRINRPGTHALVKVFAEGVGILASPFRELKLEEKTLLGFFIYKLLLYGLAGILLYRVALRFIPREVAILTVPMLFFTDFCIFRAAMFHNTELQFASPIIIAFLYLKLGERYTLGRNILFSLIVGYLMISKQNYAVYFALCIYSVVFLRRYLETGISLAVHFLPLFLWIFCLKAMGLEYYNHEFQEYGQGTWLFTEFPFQNPLLQIQQVLASLHKFSMSTVSQFTIFLPLAILAFRFEEVRKRVNRPLLLLFLAVAIMTWGQAFAARRERPYITQDMAWIILPLAAFTLHRIVGARAWILRTFFVACLAAAIISRIHFPWIHPHDQVDSLGDQRDKIESVINASPGSSDQPATPQE